MSKLDLFGDKINDTKKLDNRRKQKPAPEPTAEVVAKRQEEMVLDAIYMLGRAGFDEIRSKVEELSGGKMPGYGYTNIVLQKLESEGRIARDIYLGELVYTPREGA